MREELTEGRNHLTVTKQFQSDKFPWCPPNLVPLKMSDPDAVRLLVEYGFLPLGTKTVNIPLPHAFVLVSVEDFNGRMLLTEYAPLRGRVDQEFERDLIEAIQSADQNSH